MRQLSEGRSSEEKTDIKRKQKEPKKKDMTRCYRDIKRNKKY